MVGCGCGVGGKNGVTKTALSRRIDEVEGSPGVRRDELPSPNSTPCFLWRNECYLLPG